jgi:hypothetical protein
MQRVLLWGRSADLGLLGPGPLGGDARQRRIYIVPLKKRKICIVGHILYRTFIAFFFLIHMHIYTICKNCSFKKFGYSTE